MSAHVFPVTEVSGRKRLRQAEGRFQKRKQVFLLKPGQAKAFISNPDFGFCRRFVFNQFFVAESSAYKRLIELGLRDKKVSIFHIIGVKQFTEPFQQLHLSRTLCSKFIIKSPLLVHQELGQALVDRQQRCSQQSVFKPLDALEMPAQLDEELDDERKEEQNRYPEPFNGSDSPKINYPGRQHAEQRNNSKYQQNSQKEAAYDDAEHNWLLLQILPDFVHDCRRLVGLFVNQAFVIVVPEIIRNRHNLLKRQNDFGPQLSQMLLCLFEKGLQLRDGGILCSLV